MSLLKRTVLNWLPLAAIAIVVIVGTYFTTRYVLRQAANDPQIQMAEDGRRALQSGQDPTRVVPAATVDVAHELAPYLIVYSDQRVPVAGSGTYNGRIPIPPATVFNTAKQSGSARLTWELGDGTRGAIVVVPAAGDHPGYVLAGRSLRETETRDQAALQLSLVTLAGALATSLLAVMARERLVRITAIDPRSSIGRVS
jgi:hypothetical protein